MVSPGQAGRRGTRSLRGRGLAGTRAGAQGGGAGRPRDGVCGAKSGTAPGRAGRSGHPPLSGTLRRGQGRRAAGPGALGIGVHGMGPSGAKPGIALGRARRRGGPPGWQRQWRNAAGGPRPLRTAWRVEEAPGVPGPGPAAGCAPRSLRCGHSEAQRGASRVCDAVAGNLQPCE